MTQAVSSGLLDQCLTTFGDILVLEYSSAGTLIAQHGDDALFRSDFLRLTTLLGCFGLGRDWTGRRQMQWDNRTWVITRVMEGGAEMVMLHDITQFARREGALRHDAETDHLTNINNRRGFELTAPSLLAQPARPGHHHLVGLADLDDLKAANSARGHTYGDQLLIEGARRLAKIVRQNDCVARIGGDEFAFCMTNIPDARADAILARFINGDTLSPQGGTVSMGVTRTQGGPSAPSLSDLLQAAERNLVIAKSRGKNQLVI